ncbi:MAG: hypothetical protein RR620_11860 [Clostridium sp.]
MSIFTIIFLFVFISLFCVILFFNTNDLIHFKMIRSFYIGASVLGTLLLSFYLYDKNKNKFTWIKRNLKFKLVLIGLIVFIMQLILAKSIYFQSGWDVRAIINNAEFIVSNPEAFEYNYFMMYPNNIFLLLVFSKVYKLAEMLEFIDYRFLLVIINIVMVDLAIIMTILISKRIFNKKSVIVASSLFGLLFAFSPWIVVPYSDTLSMVFPIAILYIYIVQKGINNRWYKFSLYALMGCLTAVGSQIKPTVMIVVIAIFILEFINILRRKTKLISFISYFLVVAVGLIATKGLYNKSIDNLTINGHNLSERELVEVPFTHFAMMGMQSVYVENRGTIYGAYDPEDVTFTESFPTKEEKIEANIGEIKNRLNNFGVKGYLEFLSKKACWFLSDGTFYYGGEGNFMVSEPYTKGKVAEKLQNIFLHTGDKFLSLANVFEGIWILILFLIIYPIFEKKRFSNNEEIFIIRLTITGIVLFLLLFEARSRYLINHIPFFILLATYGFNSVYNRFLLELEN